MTLLWVNLTIVFAWAKSRDFCRLWVDSQLLTWAVGGWVETLVLDKFSFVWPLLCIVKSGTNPSISFLFFSNVIIQLSPEFVSMHIFQLLLNILYLWLMLLSLTSQQVLQLLNRNAQLLLGVMAWPRYIRNRIHRNRAPFTYLLRPGSLLRLLVAQATIRIIMLRAHWFKHGCIHERALLQ